MKTKIALAVSMALLSSAANAQTVLSHSGETVQFDISPELAASTVRGSLSIEANEVKFVPEVDLDDSEYTYIVRLRDSAAANYQGEIAGFKATDRKSVV